MDLGYLNECDQTYSAAAFWFWNDKLEPEELRRQLSEMHDKGMLEAVIHARVGLETPYLSEEWFSCVSVAVEQARAYGMKLWIYDEDNFPSGYAGGKVLAKDPALCAKHLKRICGRKAITDFLNSKGTDRLVYLADSQTGCEVALGEDLPDTAILYAWDYTRWKAAFCNDYYVDVLDPRATQVFMECTHKEYVDRFPRDCGETILGFFSDEAGLYHNLKCFGGPFEKKDDYDTVAWTDGFAAYFSGQNGYDLLPRLEELWTDTPTSAQVRYDYYNTVCQRYREAFLLPQREYCHQHGMRLIGHLHMEDYYRYQILTQGNFSQALDALDYAGLDRIDYNDRKLTEKRISSMGHIQQKPFVLSESFACAGWDAAPGSLRYWTDYQLVRGVTKYVMHAFYYSVRDDRKWDCQPSYFDQNPYWEHMDIYFRYVSRMTRLLSEGSHCASVAVYDPIETAQACSQPLDTESVDHLQQQVDAVGFCLLENQQDFDFVYEQALWQAVITDDGFSVGAENYRVLLLPCCRYLKRATMEKLCALARSGVRLVFLYDFPTFSLDCDEQPQFDSLREELLQSQSVAFIHSLKIYSPYSVTGLNFGAIARYMYEKQPKDVTLISADRDIRYLHRRTEQGDVYLFVNEGTRPYEGEIQVSASGGVRRYDAVTGTLTAVASEKTEQGTRFFVSIDRRSSAVLLVGFDAACVAGPTHLPSLNERRIPLPGPYTVTAADRRTVGECQTAQQLGLEEFSGRITYEVSVELPETQGKCTLCLPQVRECAAVSVNGRFAGAKLWGPYCFDVTEYLREGENRIEITVTTTLYNRFHHANRPTGLLREPYISIAF